jgi:hypothetical protein
MVYVDPHDGFPAWILPLEVLLEIAEEEASQEWPLPYPKINDTIKVS